MIAWSPTLDLGARDKHNACPRKMMGDELTHAAARVGRR